MAGSFSGVVRASRSRPFAVAFVLLSLLLLQGLHRPALASRQEAVLYPRALVSLPDGGDSHAILVEKQSARLLVYRHKEGDLKKVLEVPCSIGFKKGRKVRPWDGRTPEGVFWIIRKMEDGGLAPRYGIGALVLDYPNLFDKLQGRDGHGIWIHGTQDPRRIRNPRSSNGCVVVTNEAFREISSLVRVEETPVIIEPSLHMLQRQAWSVQRERFLSLLGRWKETWSQMGFSPQAVELYSRRFESEPRGAAHFLRWRGYVARRLGVKEVSLRDIYVLRSGPLAISRFKFFWGTEASPRWKGMSIYWAMEDGRWKIIAEDVLGWADLQDGER